MRSASVSIVLMVLAALAFAPETPTGLGGCAVAGTPGTGRPDLGRTFDAAFAAAEPAGWRETHDTPPDWDGDGAADRVEVDRDRVSVTWASGAIVVTGIGGGAAVGDVTGDGIADLVVVTTDGSAVLVGDGGATSGEVPVSAIGVDVAGWPTPSTDDLDLGNLETSIEVLWDLTDDQVADYAVIHRAERSGALIDVVEGRQCPAPGPRVPAQSGPIDRSVGPVEALSGGFGSVLPGVDVADPAVLATGGGYAVYATNTWSPAGEVWNVPVMVAADPTGPWSPRIDALPTAGLGTWTAQRHTVAPLLRTWAPSVAELPGNAPSHRFILYYAALREAAPRQMCIGRAHAAAATGPFVDDYGSPLLCSSSGYIDPDLVMDGAVPRLAFAGDEDVDRQPNALWLADLTSSGDGYLGTPFRRLATRDRPWEVASASPTAPYGKIENPVMVPAGNDPWLLYSGGSWDSAGYAVGWARCAGASPAVPCAKDPSGAPWITRDALVDGPGGADVVPDGQGGWWMLHHGWAPGRVGGPHVRQLYAVRIGFTPFGPRGVMPPGAPGPVTARAQRASASLSWSAPAEPGSGIAGYVVTTLRDGAPVGAPAELGASERAVTIAGLEDGVTYTFAVAARNAFGSGPPATSAPVMTTTGASRFVPVTTFRALDTRTGAGCRHDPGGTGPIGGWVVATLTLAGCGGLPSADRMSAVVANLTVVGPSRQAFLVAWPAGEPVPGVSNANVEAGETLATQAVVRTGADGAIHLGLPVGSAQVVVDVVGYFTEPGGTTGALHSGLAPTRIVDTRDGTGIDAPGTIGPGGTILVPIAGSGGLPAGAGAVSAVELNVTVVNATAPTHVTVWGGGPRPATSSVNVVPGQAAANMAVVATPGGALSIANHAGTVDVVVDVVGWFGPDGGTSGAGFNAVTPRRAVDTRSGLGAPGGPLVGGGARTLGLAGQATPAPGSGLPPAGAYSAIVGVLTEDQASRASHLTVWPTGGPPPSTSNLNFLAGRPRANLMSVPAGVDGQLDARNAVGSTHLIVDVAGWYGPPS